VKVAQKRMGETKLAIKRKGAIKKGIFESEPISANALADLASQLANVATDMMTIPLSTKADSSAAVHAVSVLTVPSNKLGMIHVVNADLLVIPAEVFQRAYSHGMTYFEFADAVRMIGLKAEKMSV